MLVERLKFFFMYRKHQSLESFPFNLNLLFRFLITILYMYIYYFMTLNYIIGPVVCPGKCTNLWKIA